MAAAGPEPNQERRFLSPTITAAFMPEKLLGVARENDRPDFPDLAEILRNMKRHVSLWPRISPVHL